MGGGELGHRPPVHAGIADLLGDDVAVFVRELLLAHMLPGEVLGLVPLEQQGALHEDTPREDTGSTRYLKTSC